MALWPSLMSKITLNKMLKRDEKKKIYNRVKNRKIREKMPFNMSSSVAKVNYI